MSAGEWKTLKIGELGRVVTGKTPPTQDDKNFGGEYPFITPRDMVSQKKIGKTERYLSEQGKLAVKNCLLPPGAVCVSCIGSDMGKVVMTTQDSVTNQQLNSIICSASFDPNFVYYSIIKISDELRNAAHHSTAVPILNKTAFSEFEIDVPDLPTQTRIAAILSALDDKIELNRQTNATLEAIAQAIFKEWFVDFRYPCATGEMQDSELGQIPKGWAVNTLEELATKIGSGATPRGGSGVYLDEGVALIRSQNVYDSDFKWEGLARISDDAATQLRNVEVEQEDVLLNITGASILRTCVVDPEALPARVNQHVVIIRPRAGISSRYIHLYLLQQKTKSYLMGLNAGASREAITKGHIESAPILRPPTDLLESFKALTTSVYSESQQLCSQSRTLSLIRDSLLPKLMSGEIEV